LPLLPEEGEESNESEATEQDKDQTKEEEEQKEEQEEDDDDDEEEEDEEDFDFMHREILFSSHSVQSPAAFSSSSSSTSCSPFDRSIESASVLAEEESRCGTDLQPTSYRYGLALHRCHCDYLVNEKLKSHVWMVLLLVL
jgi:hypothetical protein